MTRALPGTVLRALLFAALAFAIVGPLANLVLWSFAERWYFPFKLPVTWGVRYWEVVFRPTGVAMGSLATSISIALLTVVVALAVSIPGRLCAGAAAPAVPRADHDRVPAAAGVSRGRDLHQRGAHLLRPRAHRHDRRAW
jgi:hypothetical protein